jgi:hypothetical protein
MKESDIVFYLGSMFGVNIYMLDKWDGSFKSYKRKYNANGRIFYVCYKIMFSFLFTMSFHIF